QDNASPNRRRSPSPFYNNNNNSNMYRQNFNFKGLIILDSMCSRVRTYALRNNLMNVELLYESDSDIVKMIIRMIKHT
ncbi:unnamed protein product, partial [Rotaria sp. Silwood2]